MRCPVCLDSELVPHIRDGIEVDHCGRCRGMWLDRGELEKLLDLVEARSPEPRITSPEPPRAPTPLPSDRHADDRYRDDRDRDDSRYRDDDRYRGRKRKRKSPFAELLEGVFEGLD
jgi:Zn-finger nucleic acid-binding protein